MWPEHDLVFCRGDGTPLDRWHVRKEFQKITKAARPGGAWTPRELRHSAVSILSAHDVRLEDISDLVGHSSTSVTETVYRHEIRPALTDNASAMNRTLKANATELTLWVPTISSTSRDQAIFVDRATDASLSSYAVLAENDRLW